MKKTLLLLTLCMLILPVCSIQRMYQQTLALSSDRNILNIVQNVGETHCQQYFINAYLLSNPDEIVTNHVPTPAGFTYVDATKLRISKLGDGVNTPYYVAVTILSTAFSQNWLSQQVLHVEVGFYQTVELTSWFQLITPGITPIIITDPPQVVPPLTGYTISGNIGSIFSLADVTISNNGTPQTQLFEGFGHYSFNVSAGSDVNITPSKSGYVFSPVSISQTNVSADSPNNNFNMLSANPDCALNPNPINGAANISPSLASLSCQYNTQTDFIQPAGLRFHFPAASTTPQVVSFTSWGTYEVPISGLQPNTQYDWKVVPYNDYGEAANVPVWTFTTGSAGSALPLPPANLQIAVLGEDIVLHWNAVTQAEDNTPCTPDGYNIYVSSGWNPFGSYNLLDSTNSLQYIHAGAGLTLRNRFYKVKAYRLR